MLNAYVPVELQLSSINHHNTTGTVRLHINEVSVATLLTSLSHICNCKRHAVMHFQRCVVL